MVVFQIPRVATSIAKGLWQRQMDSGSGAYMGLSSSNPHVYMARAGLVRVEEVWSSTLR